MGSAEMMQIATRRDAHHPNLHVIHGVAHPIQPTPPRPRALVPAVPLIGRDREVGELRDALDAALGGSGRVVLLGGEPGIGKTRLATVLADEATSRGVPVWWGRALEDGSAPAFWPWNAGLRRWIDQAGHDAIAEAAGSWAPELAHVFPVLRDRIPGLPPSESWESQGARFRLFDLVSRFLAAVARPSGLVVVLDDLHWADRPSLKLLEFVTADLVDAPVLVVATYRDTEVQSEHPLFPTLSELTREPSTRRLSLAGLTPSDCARWITLTGTQGDPAALGEALHRETNGNPFFVGEIVHLMAGEGHLRTDWAPRVPQSARQVIARRLERLGEHCRASLGVAALCGDTFDAGLLADILEDTLPADHFARALRDRILVEVEGRPGHYGFAHALIRRVLVDELAPSARAAWHARIATVLERHLATSDAVTTELVHHLAAAGSPAALRKALDYACRGAELAARGLGWEEAVRLYEIALDVGARSGLVDAKQTVELRLALAHALRGAGDIPAARTRCDEVLAACRRTPDPAAFARAALIYAGPLPEWGRIEPAVRAVLEEACRMGTAVDDALRARLYARLAGDMVATNEVEQGERIFALCEEAAAAARRSGASGALAIALMGKYYVTRFSMRPAKPGEIQPTFQEMLAAAEAGGEHEYVAAVRYSRAMNLLSKGEPEAFSNEVDGLATAASASRAPDGLWLAEALAALRATVRGQFAEAEDARERALATGRRMQLSNSLGVYASQRIIWYAFRGRLAEIAAEIDFFVAAHPFAAGWRPFRALARLAAGDAVAARGEFQSLLATSLLASGLPSAERGVMSRTFVTGLAALCVALRDREHAPMLYERIAKRDDVWSMDACHTLGPWALILGGLARLCGRQDAAAEHFEAAIQQGRRMGSPPIVARAQTMLASLRLSMNPGAEERERIAAMLAEAAQCAEELGLVDVAARAARLQGKLAQSPATQSAADPGVNAFRNDGEIWTVRYAGRDLRLKDGKGPRYLATLLAAPGREVHVMQLGAVPVSGSRSDAHDGLSIGSLGGSLDDAPDERARREYRERLEDLQAELDEAEQLADTGRAERLRAELDHLIDQLAERFGARAQRQGPSETARKAVTKVLRTQIGKILELHPALGRHLRDSVRMGTVCVYAPSTPVEWDVGFGAR
jgi:hypothetical protein